MAEYLHSVTKAANLHNVFYPITESSLSQQQQGGEEQGWDTNNPQHNRFGRAAAHWNNNTGDVHQEEEDDEEEEEDDHEGEENAGVSGSYQGDDGEHLTFTQLHLARGGTRLSSTTTNPTTARLAARGGFGGGPTTSAVGGALVVPAQSCTTNSRVLGSGRAQNMASCAVTGGGEQVTGTNIGGGFMSTTYGVIVRI